MKKASIIANYCLPFFFVTLVISCAFNSQNEVKTEHIQKTKTSTDIKPNPRFENGVNSGFLDSKGKLWFTSNASGIFQYDGSEFSNLTTEHGLASNIVSSIIEDQQGNLWFGTDKGLSRFHNKEFVNIPLPFQDTSSVWLDKVYPIINPNAVHSLVLDDDENIWIGTGGGGAYRYNGNTFTSFLSDIGTKQPDSLFHNWIPDVEKDDNGNIWFASMTHGGVSRYDGEKFNHFGVKDGLTDDMVRVIYNDKSGNIWIGYNGNRESGFSRYDGKSMTNFYKEDGICTTSILAILEDRNGIIWFGGDRGNLCLYDGKKFSDFESKEGEKYDGIFCIVEDASGNIWFGGRHGLWKYDGSRVINMTTG